MMRRLATSLGLVVADPPAVVRVRETDRARPAQAVAAPVAPPAGTVVRPEIQALRAIAVMLVVIYHLWPSVLPGGFVGVDVFFAISGFLITAHLLHEIDRTGTVSMPRFWARRARRLLPASLMMLLFCVVATVMLVPAMHWQSFFAEIAASTAYVENWRLSASAVDYLRATNTPSPVQHFWSLSAEEQFYLVWPLLIVLASVSFRGQGARVQRAAIAIMLAVVTAASLAYSVFETAANPAAAFFVTPTRAWEFGAGGLLALLSVSQPAERRFLAARSTLAWVGIAAILIAAFTYTAATPFPGWTALLPVLGTIAVIRAGAPVMAWAPTAALKLSPVQFLGNISYSVYLWHWPLLIFAPFVVGAPTHECRVIILVLSVIAAWLTKVLVEDPARTNTFLAHHKPRVTLAIAGAGTAMVLAVAVGAGLVAQNMITDAEQASARTVAAKPACFGAAARDRKHPCHNAKLRLTVVPSPIEATGERNSPCRRSRLDGLVRSCEFGVSKGAAKRTFALLGDSHASVMRAPLDVAANAKRWRGVSVARTGCPYSLATKQLPEPNRSQCIRWNKQVPGWFAKHPEIDIVFVTAITGSTVAVPPGKTMHEAKVSGYRNAFTALPETVKHIVVIRDTPKVRGSTLECVAGAIADRRPAGRPCGVPRGQALPIDPAVVAANRFTSDRSQVIDLTASMCDRRRCDAVIGGALVHKDVHHLTRMFAATLGTALLRKINRLGASWLATVRRSARTPRPGGGDHPVDMRDTDQP